MRSLGRQYIFLSIKYKKIFDIHIYTYVQGRRRISSIIKATIEERTREKSENPLYGKNDILGKLIHLDALSLDEKVSFALDCLISGYETTSKILSLLVHFLSQSPAALEKLKVMLCLSLFLWKVVYHFFKINYIQM